MGRPKKVSCLDDAHRSPLNDGPIAIEEAIAPVKTMEEIEEIFRDNLLEALDFSANEAFGIGPDNGAKDRDLPALFAALDVQIETLIKRHKVEVKR
jgi:hypothetical protein